MNRIKGICKTSCLMVILGLLVSCSLGRDAGEAKMFSLEKVLAVDTENDQTAELGLTDISFFDVDSEGNIFIANAKSKENYVFILKNDGSLVSRFGRQGQGPGEIQTPKELAISKKNEIFITDREKVIVFSNAGQFQRELRINTDYQKIIPLDGNRYLAIAVRLNQDLSQSFQVILCSSTLEELKILDSSKIESFETAAKVNIIPTLVYWERSDSYIYTGNTEEYEIRKFDFSGEPIGSIRKEQKAIPLSDGDRERYKQRLQNYPPQIRGNFFIPDTFPPIRNIVALDDKWLFIQTYEQSLGGGYVYDIFDADGEFAGRAELEGYQVKLKGDRAYCLKQKESGYKELLVYRLAWD